MRSVLFFRKEEEGQLEGETGKGQLVLSEAGHDQADSQGSWGFGTPFALTQLWSVYCCGAPKTSRERYQELY